MAKASNDISIDMLFKPIKEGNADKLYLVWGEEIFYIEYLIKLIKTNYINESTATMDFIKRDYGSKGFDVDVVLQDIESPAWGSARKVVILKNTGIFTMKDAAIVGLEILDKIKNVLSDYSIVVFWEDKVDKKKQKLFKKFSELGSVAESAQLDEIKLGNFVRASFKRKQITIDDESVVSLVSRCNYSLALINSELSKLFLYCDAKNISNVTIDVIEELCPPDISGTIFVLTDAIGEKNVSKALLVLDNLIRLKEPITMIRFMFARQIRQLICAKELGNRQLIVSQMKVAPFVASKLERQASRFSMELLLKLYSGCASYDYKFKKGLADERQSLECLIIMACA